MTELSIPGVWPEGYKILVEADQTEEVTSGGIFIPATVREAHQRHATFGTVLRCGPTHNAQVEGREIGPGTRIIFAKYGGVFLKDVDRRRDLRLINDEDILAVVE